MAKFAKGVAQAVVAPVTEAVKAATATVENAVTFVYGMVVWNCDRLTAAVLAYLHDPEAFVLTLTPRQWVGIHNLAVSMIGGATSVDLGSKRRNNRRDPTDADTTLMSESVTKLQAALAASLKAGKAPRITAIHQSYTPVKFPGGGDWRETLPPLWVQFGEAKEAGAVEEGLAFTVARGEAIRQDFIARLGGDLSDAKKAGGRLRAMEG